MVLGAKSMVCVVSTENEASLDIRWAIGNLYCSYCSSVHKQHPVVILFLDKLHRCLETETYIPKASAALTHTRGDF